MLKKSKRRNPIATSPLLAKGGVHQRSTSAARRQHKQAMIHEIEDWQSSDLDEAETNDNHSCEGGRNEIPAVFNYVFSFRNTLFGRNVV